jgi:aspartyl-tRNA(Asn)/glutamyl-tRNA(Gln) amidotransferase subunit A
MSPHELAYFEINQVAPLLQRGKVSPVDLTRACLDRIDAFDSQINAFIAVLADSALQEAQQAEREIRSGAYRGPLHGIPIAHKDLYYTAGVRTTAASKILADFVPDEDATAVARLKQAGTVLLGKLNMHEFAAGGTNVFSQAGPVHNPWALERIPGGSSGGSAAALAAGMCLAATGSDTAGSIRIPSHCCATTGLKPTYGRVSCFGVVPLSWSLDHAGPMARSAYDCALLLQAMAGFDARDSASVDRPLDDYIGGIDHSVSGVRVGVARSHFNVDLQAEVEQALRAAFEVLRSQGAELVEVNVPSWDHWPDIGNMLVRSEMLAYHREWFAARPQDYDPWLHERFASIEGRTSVDFAGWQRARDQIRAEFRGIFERVDVLVVPVMPTTAEPIDSEPSTVSTRFTYPFNLAGLPSLALPCGFDADGLPIGMQIGAPAWQEALALRVGRAYQKATTWHQQRPSLQVAQEQPA